MRVPSISSNAMRREPQQDRAAKRLAGFLQAAAELFDEEGFDAATMTAIAERSGSSIGSLYNYFPDKMAIAYALMSQYANEMELHLRAWLEGAASLTHEQFASGFIESITEFVWKRPAFLKLREARLQFSRDAKARRPMRVTIADAFRAKNPKLSEEQAFLAANVTLQIVKGMTALYAEAGGKEKPAVVPEFKKLLTLYLGNLLG